MPVIRSITSLSDFDEAAEGVRQPHLLDGAAVGVQQPWARDQVRQALREIATFSRLREKRKSSPRGTSSALELAIE